VYRTAQEALSNARKHATGAPVHVSLRWSDEQAVLQVVNAPGAPHEHLDGSGSGMGLEGLAERAALVGGRLTAERPAPASGSSCRCRPSARLPRRGDRDDRVLVVDDQRVVRDGLTALLEVLDGLKLVGAASDGAQALELARSSSRRSCSWTCACRSWTASRPPGSYGPACRTSPSSC
jgi:hypothetical protein